MSRKPATEAAPDVGPGREIQLPAATASAPPSNGGIIVPELPDVSPAMAPRWLTPQSLDAALQLADMMAKARMVPEHLRNSPGDCLLVVSQAARWGIDPFAVAQATAIVRGKLCYEGKLVATVLRATGAIDGRLEYTFEGIGAGMAVTITGTPRGGRPKELRGTVAQWRTENGNWDKDPQSMLVYRGTRQWARLFAPEAMLGVVTPDEVEEIRDAVVVSSSPAAPPAQQVPPPPPEAQIETELTKAHKACGDAIGKATTSKAWKAIADRPLRLAWLQRAAKAGQAIRALRGPGADELIADLTLNRQDPDNIDGIIADLERFAHPLPAVKPAPAPATAPAKPAVAGDDEPPF